MDTEGKPFGEQSRDRSALEPRQIRVVLQLPFRAYETGDRGGYPGQWRSLLPPVVGGLYATTLSMKSDGTRCDGWKILPIPNCALAIDERELGGASANIDGDDVSSSLIPRPTILQIFHLCLTSLSPLNRDTRIRFRCIPTSASRARVIAGQHLARPRIGRLKDPVAGDH